MFARFSRFCRRHRSLALPWLLSGLAWACARSAPSGGRIALDEVLADAQLLRVDVETPSALFDGQGGSLRIDAGWSRPRRDPASDRRGFIVDAVGPESRILFVEPPGEDLELLASCRALGPDSDLRVSLESEGRESAASVLGEAWTILRLPVPRVGPATGPRDARLRFRSATEPGEPGSSARRERRHWATCAWLAIAPRASADEVAEGLESTSIDGTQPMARRELRVGRTFALPVAGRCEIALDRRRLPTQPACALRAELRVDGSTRASLSAPLSGSLHRDDTLRNDFERPAELRLALAELSPGGCAATRLSPEDIGAALAARRVVGRADRKQRPNVFVYSIDTLRADAVNGGPTAGRAVPAISGFASDSVRWRTAISPSSWTLPAVTSLLTGVVPARHGVLRWDQRLAAEGPPTLAELLKVRGYRTAGISHSWIVGGDYGLERGFDDFFLTDHFNGVELRSQEARGTLRDWLLDHGGDEQPLFVFIHTVDPHGPYSPPAGPFSRAAEAISSTRVGSIARLKELEASRPQLNATDLARVRALYQGEVAYADREFGSFLDLLRELGLYDGALIALVSDHGEEFLEHGGFDHGRTLYQEVVEVPLLVKFPGGVGAGRVISGPVSTLDLPATIVAAAGAEATALDGTDLRRFLGSTRIEPRTVFMDLVPNLEQNGEPVRLHGAVLADTACILEVRGANPARTTWSSYRLRGVGPQATGADPSLESARCRSDLLAELRRELAAGARGESWQPDQETLRALRAVGYIQ